MKPSSNLVRLLVETLLIVAGAEGLLMVLLAFVAPGATGWKVNLIDMAVLVLLSGPLIFWRLSVRWQITHSGPPEVAGTGLSRRKAMVFALVAQLIGLGLTAAGVLWQRDSLDAAARTQFDYEADRIASDAVRRLNLGQFGLKGLRGTYAAHPNLTHAEFQAYVASRDLQREFPGLRGFGFVQQVPRPAITSFEAEVRADHAPDFQVKTAGAAEDLWVIRYIEPIDNNRQAWGLDLGQEPVRRAAIERAVDTGEAALSSKIVLVQDGQKTPALLLFVPIYRPGADPRTPAQHRDALVGLAYAPIVAAELFDGLGASVRSKMEFDVFQGAESAEAQWIYGSAGPTAASRPQARFSALRPLKVAGSQLTIRVHSTPAFDAEQDRSGLALAGLLGIALSFLLALAVWLLASGHARAQLLAKSMTADRDRLARVVEFTNNAVMIADADMRINWINAGFSRITGYSAEDALGKTPGELIGSGREQPEVLGTLERAMREGVACRVEILNRAKDGTEYWADTELQPIRDAHGVLVGFMEIGTDITTRVQHEQKIAELSNRMAVAIEGGSDGLWDWMDLTQDAQWWSPSYHAMLGYDPQELPPSVTSHRALMHPDFAAQSRGLLQEALAGGADYDMEMLLRTKHAGYRWFRLRAKVYFDAQGKAIRIAGSTQDIHARKEAQAALLQTNTRFELAAASAGIGVWEWDLVTRELTWDAQMYRLYRRDPQQSLSLQTILLESLPPDDRARFEKALEQTIRADAKFEGDYRIRWPDDEIRHLRASARAVRDGAGKVLRLTGVNFDITEVKRAQEALAESEAFLDRAGRIAGVGGWRVDLKTNSLYWSQQIRAIHEVGEDYIPQVETAIEFYAPEAREVISAAIAHSIETGQGWDLELQLVTAKGRAKWVRSAGEVEFEDGKPVALVGAFQDVTERRVREQELRAKDLELRQALQNAETSAQELRESRNLLTSSIEALDDAFVIYDAEERLVLANSRYREFYPIVASRLVPGNRFEDIIRFGAQRGQYLAAIGREEAWVQERLAQHRQPHTRFQQRLESGRIVRVVERHTKNGYSVGFRVDITDLVVATEVAEEASRSKSQFLANMSHEIRTPMNAILGMLKLLQNTELTPRQSDYVGKTKAAARSLLGLLNDILDFSKVEAGKMELDPRAFQLDQMLGDLSVILSANVGQKDIEVLFDIDPTLPPVLVGDDMRLQQVLINLCGNAIKFTSAGSVVLRLHQVAQSADDVLVEFAVKDSGIGIAPENQQHIFSGFSQAEANTTRRFGGTGLGLAISSRLTSLLGGQLQLESALGMGSTFHFQIRLGLPAAETWALADTRPARSAAAPSLDGRERRVLVVDDNPLSRDVTLQLARSLGWQAEAAESGRTALEMVRAAVASGRPYHAVFVDWHMPEMDGWQTSREIRAATTAATSASATASDAQTVQRSLIVMVTAHGRDMLAERGAREQALLDGFLVKPVTATMLQESLREAESANSTAATGHNPMAPQAVVTQQRLQGMRILVVEDNKINQMVAQGLLSAEGAIVTLADDGERGVAAVKAANPPFDAVLMDVQMPVMDGYAATRALRAVPAFQNLPIIAMTANAMASDRAACLAAGMNDHVGKPFELDHLVATLMRLGGSTVAAQLPAVAVPAQDSSGIAPGDLDLEGTLLRLGGNATMLAEVLQSFAQDLPQVPGRVAALLSAGARPDLMRSLHTLKGLASTVGARHLAHVAAQLEAQIPDMTTLPQQSAWMATLQAAVDATALRLESALAQYPVMNTKLATQQVAAVPHAPALVAELQALAGMLERDDMQALEAYAALRTRHAHALGTALDALDQAMAGLEFEEALQCCRALLA